MFSILIGLLLGLALVLFCMVVPLSIFDWWLEKKWREEKKTYEKNVEKLRDALGLREGK